MRNKTIILLSSLALVLVGCTNIEQAPVEALETNTVPTVAQYKDTIERNKAIGRFQSNPSYILSGSLVYQDGKMSLQMTREEADSLGIPRDVYARFERLVESYNKK